MEDSNQLVETANQLIEVATSEIEAAGSPQALDEVRIRYLGRRGSLTLLMRQLSQLTSEARPAAGAAVNVVKDWLTDAIESRNSELSRAALEQRLAAERADVTLPVPFATAGRLHPISQTVDEIVAIFGEMGFEVAEGPHIEEDFYNFTALNIPPEHPARQEHDTFYLPERPDGSRLVLRTHTSPVQIRTMLAQQPPIRIIVPGRTFPLRPRCDAFADVSSGRGAGDRPDHPYGPSEGLPDRVPARLFRSRRFAGSLSAELFPVHRALGRGRHRLLAPRPANSRSAPAAIGSKSSAAAWFTRRY